MDRTSCLMMNLVNILTETADAICGIPLFLALVGGGLLLMISSGFVSIRRLPAAIEVLRSDEARTRGQQISSLQALASVVAATVGLGNIAGVTIAIVMGGPGAVFWMWVSAVIGMSTKYHEGVLAVKYRDILPDGTYRGGTMTIVRRALGHRYGPVAMMFAAAGMIGTLCIMNANQLTEAAVAVAGFTDTFVVRLFIGITIASIVGSVVLGGLRRIANVASVMVPLMVGIYFLMVLYIIVTHYSQIGSVFVSIFSEAFSLKAGWGALIGIALIGARRAALVNDAGVGTATLMHSTSANTSPVREGLVAMLGPAIDSGLVCTLTAMAVLLCVDPATLSGGDLRGLSIAMDAFGDAIPGGRWMLMGVVACFGLSSMFSYSFYGTTCARWMWGDRAARVYLLFFIVTLVIFAVIPVASAVAVCDLFYALMAFPTMFTLLRLRKDVRAETDAYFNGKKQ